MIRLLGREPFARYRKALIVRCKLCERGLNRRLGGLVLGLCRLERSTAGIGRGQGIALLPRGGEFGLGCLQLLSDFAFAFGQFLQPGGDTIFRGLGLIERPQSPSLRLDRT